MIETSTETPVLSQRRRVLSWVVAVIAALLVGVPALLVLGTFLYRVPYLGLAAFVVPALVGWFVVLPLVGAGLAFFRRRRRGDRFSAGLIVVGVVAAIGASVIAARMTAAVEDAGADINLVRTLGIGSADSGPPDAEVGYMTYEGQPLELSIYQPTEVADGSSVPILFFVHGGGWIVGTRADHSADMRWFADQGWLTISVDYTLSTDDRHLWDVTQRQLGCALAWVVQNAAQFGGDPARLSLTGDSAGGNLAINTAYMANNGTLPSACGGPMPTVAAVATLYPVTDPAGFYENDDRVLGGTARDMAGDYAGGSPAEYPERYASIASATHTSAAAPPTLLIVGEADHLVPPDGVYRFADQAEAVLVKVKLVRVPYADHVFDGFPGSIGQQAYRQLTADWLREQGQVP